MIWNILTFGGVLFWAIVAIATLIITANVKDEKIGWASFTLLLTIFLVVAFTNVPIGYLLANPIYILYSFLAYLGVAVAWATIKWRLFYLPKIFDLYESYRAKWLSTKGLKEMPADPLVREQFKESAGNYGVDVSYRRMVGHNKGRIISWMFLWPFSLIETFLGDFLGRVFTTLYKMVAGLFQRMSDSMASKYDELA